MLLEMLLENSLESRENPFSIFNDLKSKGFWSLIQQWKVLLNRIEFLFQFIDQIEVLRFRES